MNERFKWAASLLKIKPQHFILEIGCGAGLLADEIASKLTKGKVIGLDKSPAMVEKAKRRNHVFIEREISSFIQCEFLKSDFAPGSFHTIVAFNVNFFWKDPAKELTIIRRLLKTDGKLFVFHQAPVEIDITASIPIKEKLIENKFDVIDSQFKKLAPTSAFCVVAKPCSSK